MVRLLSSSHTQYTVRHDIRLRHTMANDRTIFLRSNQRETCTSTAYSVPTVENTYSYTTSTEECMRALVCSTQMEIGTSTSTGTDNSTTHTTTNHSHKLASRHCTPSPMVRTLCNRITEQLILDKADSSTCKIAWFSTTVGTFSYQFKKVVTSTRQALYIQS
jgi:hypothetical protein